MGELILSHTFFKEQEDIFNALINNPFNENEVVLLNFNIGRTLTSFNTGRYPSLALSGDTSKLVSTGWGGYPKVWNLFTGEYLFGLESRSKYNFIKCLAENRLATYSSNGFQIWNLSRGKLLFSLFKEDNLKYDFVCLEQAVNEQNTIITAYYKEHLPPKDSQPPDFKSSLNSFASHSGKICLWDLNGKNSKMKKTITLQENYAIKVIKSVSNCLLACIYRRESKIDIWNYETGLCVKCLNESSSMTMNDLGYLKHENRLISCTEDGTINIWCMSTFEMVQMINCETRVDKFELIANSNPPKFLIKENSKCFHLWDLTTKKCLYTFKFNYEIKQFNILFNNGLESLI